MIHKDRHNHTIYLLNCCFIRKQHYRLYYYSLCKIKISSTKGCIAKVQVSYYSFKSSCTFICNIICFVSYALQGTVQKPLRIYPTSSEVPQNDIICRYTCPMFHISVIGKDTDHTPPPGQDTTCWASSTAA